MSYFDFPVQANGGMTVSGSLIISGSITSTDTATVTSSYALTSSYVKLLAGDNVTINYQPDGIAISSSSGGGGGTFTSSGSVQITGSLTVSASNLVGNLITLLGLPNFATTASNLPVGALFTSDQVKGVNNTYVVCIVRPVTTGSLSIVNNISGGSVNSVSTPGGGVMTLTTGTYPVTQGETANGTTPTADGAGNSIQFNYSGPTGGTWSVIKNGIIAFNSIPLNTSPYSGNLGGMTATSTDVISITFNP